MKETFPKSSVMIMADMVGYADGGVVSKQVLKTKRVILRFSRSMKGRA